MRHKLETLQNKQTKGSHESSHGVLVRVHMLQVCVNVKHVVVPVVLRNCVIISHRQCSPKFTVHLNVNFLVIVHTAKTGLLRCCL